MPIEQSGDPKQFSDFERSGWDNNISGYDAAFGAVARQSVRRMLDAARVTRGMRVLDACCGPAMLAAGALERGAEAVGLDFSLAAVELARRLVPKGSFEQADVQALPFPAGRFDAVLCGYGLMHLPDPAAALREMLRVLRPGGRATLSVWASTGFGFSLVYEAVRARGSLDVSLPHGPDFFSLDHRSECWRRWSRRASPTPQRFPSIRTGACSMRTVTLNPFLLARSVLAPFLPLNRVRRRLTCAPIWPTI